MTRSGSLLLLSADASLRQQVAATSSWLGRTHAFADSLDGLLGLIEAERPCAVIVDCDEARGPATIEAIAPHLASTAAIAVAVVRKSFDHVRSGAHVVAELSVLPDVLRAIGRSASTAEPPPRAVEQLLGVSLLAGQLEAAVRHAELRIASGLGVERCAIMGPDGDDDVHVYCRAALASGATIVARAGGDRACESFLSVALDDRGGIAGCIGLVARGPRVFSAADRQWLQAIATRLGHELAWRGSHERATEELDRLGSNPGIDPLTGVWNRAALLRLTAMYLSTSQRLKQALGVVMIDIIDLKGINTKHGLDIGDTVLQRIVDAARTQTRIEDLVGRWTGGSIVALLQGTSLEGAHRAAARIEQVVDARLVELAGGSSGAFAARYAVCIAQVNEDAAALLERAARLVKGQHRGVRARAPGDGGDEVGATLGGTYRLLHEIGQGAVGIVYRAEDLALERPVAIKMLRPDLVEDLEVVEQLRAEASLLARLQHPNLVQVYSFAHGGGDAYIVMELVEGESLLSAVDRHRLEGTTVPIGEVLAITSELASALDALHDHGVVHRDVKPANVLRDPFRTRSVLVDVGIARRFGQLVENAGTPGYVAPEVIRGEDATHLSDVYGLAITVYTLLTLTSPWPDEERLQILTRQAAGEQAPLLSARRPELAPADEVMRAALANDPSARPKSAGAFARALSTALAGLAPVPSDKPSAQPRVILPRRAQASLANTRGVVFRSVSRAIGVREAERLRDRLVTNDPELARALSDTAPLDWLPTTLFTRLLAVAPELANRDGAVLARDVARATVRASFRRFFPASAATLMPERTMSAARTVWSRYQSWGTVSCMPVSAGEVVVRIGDTPRVAELCSFASGLFEQLVVLSGGHAPHVEHESCEARGASVCLYRVSWERAI